MQIKTGNYAYHFQSETSMKSNNDIIYFKINIFYGKNNTDIYILIISHSNNLNKYSLVNISFF